MPIVPGIAQLAALALTISSGRVAPTHRRGRATIHWLTLALSAAMGLMQINMVAIASRPRPGHWPTADIIARRRSGRVVGP
jgi:hypothetical protein